MRKSVFTAEHGFYFMAFIIAAAIRFAGLGRIPLSNGEASLAMQSINLFSGTRVFVEPHPLYVIWTGLLFFILNSTNWIARFLPALAGSFLVITPFLYRKYLGREASIILAFGFCFSPAIIGSSRQVDDLVFSVLFLAIATGLYLSHRPVGVGIFAGLSLLSGPSVWVGLIIFLLIVLWTKWMPLPLIISDEQIENDQSVKENSVDGFPWGKALPWFLGTIILSGTLFLVFPAGLSAAASSLTDFFASWSRENPVYPIQMVFGLASCEILAFIVGIGSFFRGWWSKEGIEIYLGRLFFIAFLVVFVYPGHRVIDLVWVIIPLWSLASRQIARWYSSVPKEPFPAVGQTLIILMVSIFGFMNLTGIFSMDGGGAESQLRWLSFAGAAILCLLMTVLIAWGWSLQIASFGLRTGLGVLIILYTLFAGWQATGLGRNPTTELWRTTPIPQGEDLLLKNIGDFSEWNAKNRMTLDISVIGINSPALNWALRNQHYVTYSDSLSPDNNPSLLITPDQNITPSIVAYTGQGFTWWQSASWSLMLPKEWLQWMFYRDAPIEKKTIILWVRSDLFPGAVRSNLDLQTK